MTDHQNSAFYDLTSSDKDNSEDFSFDEEQANYKSTSTSSLQSPVFQEQFEDKSGNKSTKSAEVDGTSFTFEFDDLNDAVSALLKKAKDSQNGKEIKRRQRKNKDQINILHSEFEKCPNWSRAFVKKISQRLGLRECQVYKWHWDMLRKSGNAQTLKH